MKKVLSLLAVAGLIAASTAAFGKTIVGSKHDLSQSGGGTIKAGAGQSTQICVYCHAPHNAAKSLPLWNRTNPAGSLFTLYSGLNMQNVSFKTGFTSDSTSLFCMSCHDGLTTMDAIHNAGAIGGFGGTATDATSPTAADAYRTAVGGTFVASNIGAIGNAALGSYNLTKTHPINFEVTTTDGQSDLFVGSASKMGNNNQFPLFKLEGNRATTRSLECGSCHAVHDSQYSPFLRATMNQSALCLGCHNK